MTGSGLALQQCVIARPGPRRSVVVVFQIENDLRAQMLKQGESIPDDTVEDVSF
jgi:hypothetical protein